MRLTVKVLPLTADNARGPHQADALAAFQQRVFALPVDAQETFDQVWRKVEDRYKKNYLAPQHAAFFAIKKLQDGRDCDLDLSDTVGSIFGDEAVKDRVVQVIPSFTDRLFSMPPDTNLRPNPNKRPRAASHARSNKRVRQEPAFAQAMDMYAAADSYPILSVESDDDGARMRSRTGQASPQGRHGAERSHTGGSVTLVRALRHEQPEFTTHIKSESPELGVSPSHAALDNLTKSPGRLKKPAHHSYDMTVTTPDETKSQAEGQPSPKSSETRMTQSTSASGGMREAYRMKASFPVAVTDSPRNVNEPNTPASYASLKKTQLADLLLARGLTPKENGKRNKVDMVRRLIEYDERSPIYAGSSHVVQETPQANRKTKKKKHVLQSSTKQHAPNIDASLQLDGHVSEHHESSHQSSGSPLPVQNHPSAKTLPQNSRTLALEPPRVANNADQLGEISTDEPLRPPSPHLAHVGPDNGTLAVDRDSVTEVNNYSSGLRLSQTKNDVLENRNPVSLESFRFQAREAANGKRPNHVQRNSLGDPNTVTSESSLASCRAVPSSQSLEHVQDTRLEDNTSGEDAVSCPNEISRPSPELGASYYLNGGSSVWKRNDSTTSEDKAKMADEQAVEELRGTEGPSKAGELPNPPESSDEIRSSSSSIYSSTRSSPIVLREPAQWLARSPSPHRLESDEESSASRATSRSQSPVGTLLNGDFTLDHDSNDSKSDSELNERDIGRVDMNRTPSPTPPDAPTSAQPLRSSVIPNTQYSSTQVPTSQLPLRSTPSNGGINAWFTSASQPLKRSSQANPRAPSASQPALPKNGPRNTTVFTSLKAMLNNARRQPNVLPTKSNVTTFEAGNSGSLSQKKLPTALDEDSEDEKSRDTSSSSSDEGS